MQGDKKKINIKIFTTEGFPFGLAASNRIMTYAKGFDEHNCNISIYCIKPTERPGEIFNTLSAGICNGISFYYPGGKTVLDKNFLRRRLDNIKAIKEVCFQILQEKKTLKTDVIIYYSTSTSRALIFFLITRLKKILLLKEESEFPSIYLGSMNFLQKFLFKKFHYRLFDGYLIMTQKLINYFQQNRNLKILHVPMTVDYERFAKPQNKTNHLQYIAYCGVLNNKKDGVDILINSFALIAKEFPDIQLYLIGNASTKLELDRYKEQVNDKKLLDRIVFTGRVSKDEIPELLINAKLLVLSRPDSLQAEGGFPTKLGEYLSTGNPVVVSRVGEIPHYLTDGLNVFMADPGSVDSLANNIRIILSDYPNAKEIGKKGKEAVLKHFNYKVQTNNIIQFIKSFN